MYFVPPTDLTKLAFNSDLLPVTCNSLAIPIGTSICSSFSAHLIPFMFISINLSPEYNSVQSNFKDKMISVEYISKKGKEMCHGILIPIGRKIKQELVKERRREALKAKHASR